jgi:alpha-glucosidase
MPRWWESAVVYQIYPRSFADANGDGVGDLAGVRRHLDHLQWLGVDAVWLSPFFPSPMADFGYDVADYCDVDPLFGTLEDFDALVADAHARDIRVLIDWVPNHTSDRHPWFRAARSRRDDPHRDWYIWRDPTPDGAPPNNWRRAFDLDLPAWTFDEPSGQWYLHLFLPEQPDLNWANPAVQHAMHDTLRFWLDRGVDGFRMDVIHAIGKDPELPDDPPDQVHLGHTILNDRPETHGLLRGIRSVLDEYPDRMAIGEVYLLDTARVARYYGEDDELTLSFNFLSLYTPWEAAAWRTLISDVERELRPLGAWPTWVLSSHDAVRHRTRLGSESRARAAAVLLLTLRGTPFLYAGEELGLEQAEIPEDRVVDPGGRDGCRAPFPWDDAPDHGWGPTDPWLPWPPQPDERNVTTQAADAGSILHLYRRLLAARRASPALSRGELSLLDTPDGVLAYRRRDGGDERLVAVNFTDAEVRLPASGPGAVTGIVEVAADGADEGADFAGVLSPDAAVVLRP